MATHVSIKDVKSPQHLEAFVIADVSKFPSRESLAKMEVYTGWVIVGHQSGSGIVREEFVSFLPFDTALHVQQYNPGDVLDFTVTAAPSSVTDQEEEHVTAVDSARVRLEPQVFPGVGGNPNCLVLRAAVAGLRSTVNLITYQVTVLTKLASINQPLPLGPDTKPT